jgi:hypothetical protein
MFDSKIPRQVRALSMFHVALPPLTIWLLHRYGYDSRGLLLQTLLAWIVLPVSYLTTKPADNVNWVYGFGKQQTPDPRPSVCCVTDDPFSRRLICPLIYS